MDQAKAGAVPTDSGKTLYLLDAMALAYRAHFVFISRPLINSKGLNTSATYGFMSALVKLIEDHDMEYMAVVFDVLGEGGTFRDDLYEAYKAHRDPPPDELLANIPSIKSIVAAMDIPILEMAGVEADDVIGTLARRAEDEGADVVIVSPDKDFQQLISPQISIFRPAHRGESFDPITLDRFHEKYGLEPLQFIDVLALVGDKSDNVPGVYGIGEKGAIQLIQAYDTVENLLEHAEDVKGKRAREGLLEHRADALLSKRLVTIRTDLDVPLDWKQLRRSAPDINRLVAICRELEFNSLQERILKINGRRGDGHPAEATRPEPVLPGAADPALEFDFGPYEPVRQMDREQVAYRIVRNAGELRTLAGELKGRDRWALDTETTSIDPMMASLVGLSVSWEEGTAWYVPTPLPDGTRTEEVLDILRPVLENESTKIGHNLKYDLEVLARHGVRVRGPLFDTMVAHYLIAPEEPHNLNAVTLGAFNYRMVPITDLLGTGKNQRSMRDVPIDEVGPYACEDADYAFRLADRLQADLEVAGLDAIARDIEFPLIYVLMEMEMTGVRVSQRELGAISKQLDLDLKRLEREIHETAGEPFNIGSPQQLGEILFDKLGLRVVSKTSTGRPSTREQVLHELATEHPLPGMILDWRQLAKLKSTYVDALGELIHPETGHIHTQFNQTIAATGRLSSSNPNLQNIPIRTEQGRAIRQAFIPPEGHLLMAADYVQIELRLLASMSGDENLKRAFREGQDIHTAAAANVFKVPPEKVTRDQRRKAKEINYGIPYGISAFGLAQRLRTSVSEAQELIDSYQRSYPGVSRFLAMLVEQARERGYVETLLGRRRYVPDINARNHNVRSAAERVAVNMPMQGTQADMIKIAMVRIHDRLVGEGLKSKMILQVHDELVFAVLPEEVDTLRALIEYEMVHALPLDVPIEVEINVGENWLAAH